MVFDISRYMIEDGPGIRTTVFFKGCPLRCVWCSNPFGLSREPEIVYNRRKCVLCGACLTACPQNALRMEPQGVALDRDRCTTCGSCVTACLSAARTVAGRIYSPREIVLKVLDDSSSTDVAAAESRFREAKYYCRRPRPLRFSICAGASLSTVRWRPPATAHGQR